VSASNLYVPTDSPASVSIKTSSYTIPAGRYAKVSVTDFKTDFTIDGSVAIEQMQFDSSASTGSVASVFSNSTPYPLVGNMIQSSTAIVSITDAMAGASNYPSKHPYTGNAMTMTTGNTSIEIYLNPNDRIYITNSAGGTVYWNLMAVVQPVQSEFIVPTGTQLNGSRYIVEEYVIGS
jgi:hypothetical protein